MYKRLRLLSLGILILLTLHSCKKDRNKDPIENRSGAITLGEAQSFFETQVLPNSKLSMAIKKSNQTISVKDLIADEKINDLLYKTPLWNKAYSKGVNNGTALAIPIHFDVKSYIRTDDINGINFDNLNYLLVTKSPSGDFFAEWVTLYPDMTWIKGNRQIYTGRIVVADWDGNVKQSILFEKSGKVSTTALIRSFQSVAGGKAGSGMPVTEYYHAVDGKCYENIREVPSDDGIGVTLYRKEVDCPQLTATPVNGTDPLPPPKDPSIGTGSPGNYTPPNCNPDPNYKVPTGPLPPGQHYISPCSNGNPISPEPINPPNNIKDPCKEKTTVSNNAANSIIADQNAKILLLSTSKEYGTNQTLIDLVGGVYKKTSITTDGSTDSFDPSFTWNSTDGYTIGWSHGHPGGSAPSPDDIFVMIDNLSNQDLISAGSSAIKFYRDNVSMTVVTSSGNFVVTVNDWGKLSTLFNTFNADRKAFEDNYIAKGGDYLKINNSASNSEAGVAALLNIFGSAINIYQAQAGSTAYSPKTLTNNQVTSNPCGSQ